MPHVSRLQGSSYAGVTREPTPLVLPATRLHLTGPDSDITVDGGLTVDGLTTLRPLVTYEVDTAEVTSNFTLSGFNGFNIFEASGLLVTVPDLDEVVYIEAQLWMEHAGTANANLSTLIAVSGLVNPGNIIGTQIAAGTGFVGAAGKEASPFARARLDPHSPGDYAVYGYTDTAGNVNVIANESNPLRITAYRVAEAA